MIDKDIQYIPIFNQNRDGVLDSFVDVEMHARSGAYNEYFLYGAAYHLLEKYESNLKLYKNNMAFGAYKDDKLIGFVNGYIQNKGEITLDSLFVEPDYQKKSGVGTHLLSKFENAAYLVASKSTATALSGARSFYKKRGYRLYQYSDTVEKSQLKMPLIGVVPVFDWHKSFRIKSNVIVDDKWLGANKYQPIFVYIGETHEIEGVGALGKDGTEKIWVNENRGKNTAEFFRQQLRKYLTNCVR